MHIWHLPDNQQDCVLLSAVSNNFLNINASKYAWVHEAERKSGILGYNDQDVDVAK